MFAPYDDDDDTDDGREPMRDRILAAVAIAGLSAIVVKFAEWGVEEFRKRVSPKKKKDAPASAKRT